MRTPIIAANSIGDPWIPPISRDYSLKRDRNTSATPVDLNPVDFGLTALGHRLFS
jgi:predicted alpha/beta hydrolase